ncbi:MAG TPA: hypothetical protein VGP82_23920 [Ktedonobacterales bacterium]|nr:hypothetical protein [Ktedonobacterales bacterium]
MTNTRAIYRHNRHARMQVMVGVGPASRYAEFVASIRTLLNWLNAPPAVPFAMR